MNAERAQELKSSLMWKEIVEEIDKKVNYEVSKLRSCKPEDLLLIQAKLDCLESITRLPGDIIDRES